MATFSSLNTITLALLAIILAIATVQSAPTPAPSPAPVADPKVPVFSIFSKDNEKGATATVSKFGCHNHGLKAVAGVHYRSGPHAQIKFYTGKDCKGKVTHSMPINTYKSMGGPYKSQSVLVFKGTGTTMQ
ncbi:hypothetical protein BKA57DRAFT_436795 [Linnemannia elongata]|nr:hypothetical protein BGZ88_009160 [Linnemannia elongata]KAH7050457.1 hypothetical protein BKA57DRAFT_436795 [Linnemannia elongata]KAK5822282.1 hypothetical protein F5H01DRAFT_335369 [Linnemannia elongata]